MTQCLWCRPPKTLNSAKSEYIYIYIYISVENQRSKDESGQENRVRHRAVEYKYRWRSTAPTYCIYIYVQSVHSSSKVMSAETNEENSEFTVTHTVPWVLCYTGAVPVLSTVGS